MCQDGEGFIDNDDIDAENNYNNIMCDLHGCQDTDQLNAVLNQVHKSSDDGSCIRSMLHINARSLVANLDSIYANLLTVEHKFSVLAITETWTNNYTENSVNFPGYTKYINSRVHSKGGGVALYFDSQLKVSIKLRDDLKVNTDLKIMECMFVQVSHQNPTHQRFFNWSYLPTSQYQH